MFADPVSEALGLSQTWFFDIFSGMLPSSGLLGLMAGCMIDRHGGRDVLAATNIVFTAGLVLLAMASGPVTLAVTWAVIGAGMGFGHYEAAFAAATGLYGRDARNATTLFAGFASTTGQPASAVSIDWLGWRGACLAWAALHLIVGLPLNRFLVPKAPVPDPVAAPFQHAPGSVPWTMIVLAAVSGATWFIATAMVAHMPRLLEALGATTAVAVFAAFLVGPAQVAAPLVESSLLSKAAPILTARLAAGLHPVGAVLLALAGPAAAIPFGLLHGGGSRLLTIARSILPLALFGPAGYSPRTGLLAAPARILQGSAPLLSGSLTGLSLLTLLPLRSAKLIDRT